MASDYTITHLAQCDGSRGVCPDERLGGNNDVVVGLYHKLTMSATSLVLNMVHMSGSKFLR